MGRIAGIQIMIPFYDKKLLQKLKSSLVSIERNANSQTGPRGRRVAWGVMASRDGDLIVPTDLLELGCHCLMACLQDGSSYKIDLSSPQIDGPMARIKSSIPRKKSNPVSIYRSLPRFPLRCQIMPLTIEADPLEEDNLVGGVLEPPAERDYSGRALGLRPSRSLQIGPASLVWTEDWRIAGSLDFRLGGSSQDSGNHQDEAEFIASNDHMEPCQESNACSAPHCTLVTPLFKNGSRGATGEGQPACDDQREPYCIPAASSKVFGFCKIISFSDLHRSPRLREVLQQPKGQPEPPSKVVSLFEFRENQARGIQRKSMESYMEGLLYLEKGAGERALDCFRKAAFKDPFQCNTLFMIGYCLSRLGRHEEAIDSFHQALISEPEDPSFMINGAAHVPEYLTVALESYRNEPAIIEKDWSLLFDLGIICERTGHYSESAEAFKKALELEPADAETWNRLGMALFNAGRHEDSVEAYNKALELEPTYAAVYDNLGVVMGRMGRVQEEISYYRKALEQDSNDPIAHYNLGLACYNQGNFWEAIKEYREAVRLEPENAATLTNLGLVYDELGMFEEAAEKYRGAIEIDPYLVEPRNNLGVILENLGRRDEAREAYTEAVKAAPDYPAAHYNLGVLLFEDSETEKALEHFARVAKLEPENPNVHFYLAIIAFKNNDLGTAMKEQAILTYLDPAMANELSTRLLDQ